jgi:hypothetical protein
MALHDPTAEPNLIIHELNDGAGAGTGAPVTGVAPTGTLQQVDANAPFFNGRVWKFTACDDGGLFTSADQVGWTVSQINWQLLGTTTIDVFLVDPGAATGQSDFKVMDGTQLPVLSSAPDITGGMWRPVGGLFVPPLWQVKVVTTGGLSAPGAIAVTVDGGWVQRVFQSLTG